AIDLDVTDLAVFHEMLGHVVVVRGLAAGYPDGSRFLGELSIGIVSTAVERLLKPRRLHLFQHRKPRLRGSDIFAPDLPCIDEEHARRTYAFTRRGELIAICLERAAAEWSPTAFDRSISFFALRVAELQRFLRRIAEELRCVWQFRVGARIAEKPIGRFAHCLTENIPQRHLDAGEGVRGLKQ